MDRYIPLSKPQMAKLQLLEDDDRARVIGTLDGCPVILHHGVIGNRVFEAPRFAVLAKNGRLHSMGSDMRRRFRLKNVRR